MGTYFVRSSDPAMPKSLDIRSVEKGIVDDLEKAARGRDRPWPKSMSPSLLTPPDRQKGADRDRGRNIRVAYDASHFFYEVAVLGQVMAKGRYGKERLIRLNLFWPDADRFEAPLDLILGQRRPDDLFRAAQAQGDEPSVPSGRKPLWTPEARIRRRSGASGRWRASQQ